MHAGFHRGVFHLRPGGGVHRQRGFQRGPDGPSPVRVGGRGHVAPEARTARNVGEEKVLLCETPPSVPG